MDKSAKSNGFVCPCVLDPDNSPCCIWEENEQVCHCVDLASCGTIPP